MHLLTIGFLLPLLVIATWHDIRNRRIPNVLVFTGAVVGLLLNTALPGDMGGLGPLDSVAGLTVGLASFLPLYLLRMMGAGDAKLMAMVGAFLGVRGVIGAVLCVLLAGGVLALAAAWRQGDLRGLLYRTMMYFIAPESLRQLPLTAGNLSGLSKSASLPYGLAIAAGTAAYLAVICL
jgi:prepilin peptidase CpaA